MSSVFKPGTMQQEREIKPYCFFEYFKEEENTAEPEIEKIQEKTQESSEEIIRDAYKQAERLLADARAQAQVLREDAFAKAKREGYQDGYQAAYEEKTKEMNEELMKFQREAADCIRQITLEKEKVMERYLEDLKRTVLAIAEKIIQTSLKSSNDVIRRMIIHATDKLKKTQWAKIYITKCKTSIGLDCDREFLKAISHMSDNIKIIEMEGEEPGTCIIENEEEVVDASVSTQLENIRDILNNARI